MSRLAWRMFAAMAALVLVTAIVVPVVQWWALRATLDQLPPDVRDRVVARTTPLEPLGRWVRPRFRPAPSAAEPAPTRSVEEENARLFVLLSDLRATQRRSMVVGVGVSIVLCALAAMHLARDISRPIEAVGRAAAEIAEGKLATRVALAPYAHPPAEAVRLAQHFDHMAAALERSEAERKAMIADVAHELRTPLATTQLRLEAIRDGLVPFDAVEVEHLLHYTALLGRLVDDLRLLALADAGRLGLRLQPLDLVAWLRLTVEGHRTSAEARGVALGAALPPGAIFVGADPDRLQQVLHNLLDNAVRVTPSGGRVEVALSLDGDLVNLSVRDTGPGFSSDRLAHAFDRFAVRERRDRSERGASGSGLGLAIVRALVEVHGGTVRARNRTEGAEVVVTLSRQVTVEAEPSRLADGPGGDEAHEIDTMRRRSAHEAAPS